MWKNLNKPQYSLKSTIYWDHWYEAGLESHPYTSYTVILQYIKYAYYLQNNVRLRNIYTEQRMLKV